MNLQNHFARHFWLVRNTCVGQLSWRREGHLGNCEVKYMIQIAVQGNCK